MYTKHPKSGGGGEPPIFPRKLSEIFPDGEFARVIEERLTDGGVSLDDGLNSLVELESLQKIKELYLVKPSSVVPSTSLDEKTQEFKILAAKKMQEEGFAEFAQDRVAKVYEPSARITNFEGLQYLTELRRFESYYHDFYDFSYLNIAENALGFQVLVSDAPISPRTLKNLSFLGNMSHLSCGLLFAEDERKGDKSLVTIAKNDFVKIKKDLLILILSNVNITHFKHFILANDQSTSVTDYIDCAITDLRGRQGFELSDALVHYNAIANVATKLHFENFVNEEGIRIPISLNQVEFVIWDEETNEVTFQKSGEYTLEFYSKITSRRYPVIEAVFVVTEGA